MSDSSPDIAGLIAEATELQWVNCVIIAGTALVLYEYFITFSTEIQEIWNSKFTGARVLFCLTRYFYLFYLVFNCATNFSPIASKMVVADLTLWPKS
ncbi:hypothetical protein BD410DRAFT_792613 [Rickenella mellea]|uniref:DUF6533 domain-containing protein n=1 Tax=Rickenella mellea TaxID=50990 RepID=A0A4Y7PVB7_9AGAM|nr:hypothetical protein BD410DRAFT_792613 [Rickenella mellea]